jgi:ankyrin repeat protein
LSQAETSNNRKMAVQPEAVDAMFDAIEEDNVEEVKKLLDQDRGLLEARTGEESEFELGSTPLIVAAAFGHVQIVTLLLERGAEVGARDDLGVTAILAAASCGHEEIVALLLRHGADGLVRCHGGVTPLQSASRYGQLGVVRLLLQHLNGRGIDDADQAEATALWSACRWGHTEVVRALLMTGADPTIAGRFLYGTSTTPTTPTTPIKAAEINGHYDIVNLIEVCSGAVCVQREWRSRLIRLSPCKCLCDVSVVGG